jgi:hypothetical protein
MPFGAEDEFHVVDGCIETKKPALAGPANEAWLVVPSARGQPYRDIGHPAKVLDVEAVYAKPTEMQLLPYPYPKGPLEGGFWTGADAFK